MFGQYKAILRFCKARKPLFLYIIAQQIVIMAFLLQFCLLPNRNTTSGLNRPRPCHTEHPAALYAAPAA